ncbi:hypothetical protein SAMD00079811_70170 [Scytonema sp. HK-05]|nr:hypothetical protein SAMD00079811_70170 [Scytonema sp. HK-05]
MMVGAFVLPVVSVGMMEASTTRKTSIPCTRSSEFTTAIGSVPRNASTHRMGQPSLSLLLTDDVRLLQPERVGKAHNELAHRARKHERVAALGVSEAREVDRHEVRVLGKPRPRWLERIQALRPRTEEEGMHTSPWVLTLGVADG